MEIKEKHTYKYNGFNEKCSGFVKVICVPARSIRVEVSRNLDTGVNPFWVNKCDLEEIMTDEERSLYHVNYDNGNKGILETKDMY